MLDRYEALLTRAGWGWGEDFAAGLLAPHLGRLALAAEHRPLPPGVAVASDAGLELGTPLPYATGSAAVRYAVVTLVEGAAPAVSEVDVTASAPELTVGERRRQAVEPVPTG